jgi:ubiquinone/menaquinone biosynthesis C-methylase UbiE
LKCTLSKPYADENTKYFSPINLKTMNEQIEQQRQTWNKYSVGWKKWDGFMRKQMEPVTEAMIKRLELKGTEHLLDIASGAGEPGLTAAASLSNGKVTAIDLSEKMVAIANEHAKERNVDNFKSQVSEVSNMPFENNFFDGVMCRFGVMFFPDMRESLHEIMRVLKPGGMLIVAVWADPAHNPFISIMGMTVMEKLGLPKPPDNAPGIFRFAKPGLLSGIFNDADFTEVNEWNIEGEIIFDSVEQFWEMSSEVAGPIMEALQNAPAKTQEDVKKAVLDKAKNFIQGDGKMHSNWKTIVVSGEKK